MWCDVNRYISTSPKRKLKNNSDVTDYFATKTKCVGRPKNAAVMDISISYRRT